MFDIGGWEFLFIMVVALVVIGPKDLPGALRSITGWIRKARDLAREFQGGMDDLAKEVELDKITSEIKEDIGLDEIGGSQNSIRAQLENAIDPDGKVTGALEESRQIIDDTGDKDDLAGYDFDESDLSGSDETTQSDNAVGENDGEKTPVGEETVAEEAVQDKDPPAIPADRVAAGDG